MTDLKYGAMNGFAPNYKEWVSNQSYIRRQLHCLLLEAPKGFNYLPDPESWIVALKQLVEVHAKSIDGLAAGLEVAVAENPTGGANEIQQDPTNVTRARSEPSFVWIDKYGRPIQNFLESWITMLIMDPESKVPGVFALEGVKPDDLLADQYGATMLFFEPDPTHTFVAKAWLSTNMFPLSNGENIGKRNLSDPGEASELNIKFSAISQTGVGVRNFAQSLLDKVNFQNANPNLRPAFMSAVSPDVLKASGGWTKQVASIGAGAVLRG